MFKKVLYHRYVHIRLQGITSLFFGNIVANCFQTVYKIEKNKFSTN